MYTSESSNALTLSENKDSWRYKNDREKSKLSSMYIKSGHILEIGCGTGQILSQIKSKGFKVGVDYSNDRLKSSPFKNKIVFVQADVKSLPFTDNYFSNIVMSHFFHELIQFEEKKNLKKTIKQILSKLKHKGRIIIIDHCDPGKGYIKFEMNKKSLEIYKIFKKKFKFYKKDPLEYKNVYRLNNLQNFITKIWSMGTDAENLEMNERQKGNYRMKNRGAEGIQKYEVRFPGPMYMVATTSITNLYISWCTAVQLGFQSCENIHFAQENQNLTRTLA